MRRTFHTPLLSTFFVNWCLFVIGNYPLNSTDLLKTTKQYIELRTVEYVKLCKLHTVHCILYSTCSGGASLGLGGFSPLPHKIEPSQKIMILCSYNVQAPPPIKSSLYLQCPSQGPPPIKSSRAATEYMSNKIMKII